MDRYLSQRLYKNIGINGQEKLKASAIAIVGVGSLGSVCSELLVRAGIGKIVLFDRDYVELTNLQRQVLYEESDIGKLKVLAAQERLKKINSQIQIIVKSEDLDHISVKSLGSKGKIDLVIAATDNMESRFILNDYCLKMNIPMIYGGAVEDKGSVFSVIPGKVCLRCIFHGSTVDTCDNTGILNSCSSVIGSMIAGEAIKILLGKGIEQDMIYFDAWKNEMTKINVKKGKDCPACNGKYDYLDGVIKTKLISLCGNETYHFKGNKKDLNILSAKLSKIGEVKKSNGLIHFNNITLFEDGRAIIKAKSEKRSKKTIF